LAATKSAGREPDFRAMQAEVDKAWCSLHAENAAPFYARGADNVFFDAAPLKYQGWAVVWIRQGGKWLIAHEHVSAPLPS
jgi:hypothetical protein